MVADTRNVSLAEHAALGGGAGPRGGEENGDGQCESVGANVSTTAVCANPALGPPPMT